MIDTINPMNFDITKNLHGHVRVETKDRWTGRVVESQEKDNLVTDALSKIIYAQIWMNGYAASWLTPLYTNALGGIVLYGNTLTESASNIWMPSDQKPIAIAGQDSNTSDIDAGSFNSSESVATSNGYTSVWDFTTSQANGTISALSRVHRHFRESPMWLIAPSNPNIPTVSFNEPTAGKITPYYLGYDKTNKYLYFTPVSNQTISGVTYSTNSIYRTKADFSKLSLVGTGPFPEKTTLVKTLTSSDGTTTAYNYLYDKYNNNFVYINGTTAHFIAIDGTHTTATFSNTGAGSYFTATENYYWKVINGTAYRISKTNYSNITQYSLDSSAYCLAPFENDCVAAFSAPAKCFILYPDGTFETKDGLNGGYSWTLGSPRQIDYLFAAQNNSSNLFVNSRYLGTIANLDSPVTKTSSQTMKITYTLTEA